MIVRYLLIAANAVVALWAVAPVVGCASKPYCYVHGRPRIESLDENIYSVVIVAVNGKLRGDSKVRVDPGYNEIAISPWNRRVRVFSDSMAFAVDIMPCKNYYVVARFEDQLSKNWVPQLIEITDLVGCSHGTLAE